jgi:hypothetical protein
MSHPPHFFLTLHDRDEIDRKVEEFFARGPAWNALAQRLPSGAGDGSVFCVQRQACFLADHSIEENWMLPLWELAGDDQDEWNWLLELGRGVFARYSDDSPAAYPAQLDELSLLAAQFGQAHIMMSDILVLDSVFSGWHRTDQAQVGRMVRDYAGRHPFRAVVHVDVTEPPPGVLSFLDMETGS